MLYFPGKRIRAFRHGGEQIADESRVEFAGRGAQRGHPPHIHKQDDGVFRRDHVEIEGQFGLAGVHFGKQLSRTDRGENGAISPVIFLFKPNGAFEDHAHGCRRFSDAKQIGALLKRFRLCIEALQHRFDLVAENSLEKG